MSPVRTSDQRSSPRLPHSGRVEMTFQDPGAATIEAELIDISATGFRAAHACKVLSPGLEVQYRREGAAGRARVIWTYMLHGQSVSGFLVL
jgi:hypothetical protein